MSARQSLCISLLCAAFSLTTVPIVAHADPPPTPASNPSEADLDRARELFDNGKSLYLDGSYDPAIAAFTQSYALSGDPILLYNIAHAHDRAGHYDDAIEYFEYYRAFAPASEREALEEKVEGLRRRKLKAQTEEGSSTETTDPGEPGPQPTDEPGEGSDEVVAAGGDIDEDTGETEPRIFGPAAIALTAVAVVGLGTGTGLAVASRGRNNDADALCGDSPVLCPVEAQSHVDASGRFALGADIAFGVGAAAGVAAIVVIALAASKRNKGEVAARASRFKIAAHRRGAGLQVRF